MKKPVKKVHIIIVSMLIIVTISIICTIKYINYISSSKYKLINKGYSENDIILIEDKIINIDNLINIDYSKDNIKFINEKYFIEDNLEKYINYYKENVNTINEVIAIINIGRDKKFFEDSKKADTSLDELILVNKYNYLDKDYIPNGGITSINSKYGHTDNYVATSIYSYVEDMFKAASNDGINLVINSSYRDYGTQEATYSYFEYNRGIDYVKEFVAKPGYSEHQTGYVLDIFSPDETSSSFPTSNAYKWLIDNSYKYGFILRYPEDKKYLTGYNFEPWHYRFVGIKPAKIINKENLTFEEYYTYYIK